VRPVSAAFLAATSESHIAVRTLEVLRDGAIAATITTIADGTVTLDQTVATRGRLDVTIADDGTLGLVPRLASDLLAPYGTELRVSRGVRHPAVDETVSLGIFRIDDVTVDDGVEHLTIQIAGSDRSAKVIDARFEDPYQVPAGMNYADAIRSTIEDGVAGITFNFPTVSQTAPNLVAAEGDDRWDFCQKMAQALGMTLYFDGDGVCTMRPVATPDGIAVAAIAEGQGGVLLNAQRRWTRHSAFNRVIATGENTGETAPARGVATDDNPLSPTYYYGAFGRVPRFYSSPMIATDEQAASAAASLLAREIGTTQSVNFGAVVNPALEPDDIITVTRQRLGVDERHIIDQITIPLTVDAATSGATRAVIGVF
jgi:hypothetical protein